MPNYRLPGGLAQITVNGRTYRADASGLVTATGADAAAIAGAGGLVDGGAGSAPEWSLDATGTADGLIGPDGTKATGNTAIAAAALAGNIAAGLAVDGTGLAYLAGNNVFTGANRFQSIGVGFTPATTASGYGPSLFTAMGQIASTSAGDAHYVYFGARHNGSEPIRNSTYGGAAIYIDQGTWTFNRFVGATAGSGIAMTSSLVLDNNGNVVPGTSSALATNATNGFMYLTSMAGIPGGTPTAYTSRVPIVIDSTNLKLMAYIGGAWKGVTLA